MVEQILQAGDPRLTAKNHDLDFTKDMPLIQSVLNRMVSVMQYYQCVGLAAPQIGENINLFITEIRATKYRTDLKEIDPFRVYINSKITYYSAETVVMTEGCGSVNHSLTRLDISRPKDIIVVAYGLDGNQFKIHAYDLLARVILHEHDHILGKLMTSYPIASK